MSSSTTVVLDNGGGQIKAGIGGTQNPTTILSNCLIKPPSSKKYTTLSPTTTADLTSASIRRPYDRGYLINPDLQRDIWSHLFTSLKITPSNSSLLLNQPLLSPPSISQSFHQLVFEDFGFESLFVSDSPSLVHLYEAEKKCRELDTTLEKTKRRCSLVVDCGFSFTHVAPVLDGFVLDYGVRRMDLGGKALTNYLKELVSYRSVNVMDETLIMDDVKERLCMVSMNVDHDLGIARRTGKDNLFRCTYVLPDGVTHMKGFVKDPKEAQRYLNGVPNSLLDPMEEDGTEKEDRKKCDLNKNEFKLTNERFLVPEMLFRPADLGMNQAGLAECIVRSVNSCHPHLHPALYESIILSGGSTLFPRFAERLEMELRPLVPDDYKVKITTLEDPILGVWRGGSLLASSPDFESMCVTKAEYEELGSARCQKRFFH